MNDVITTAPCQTISYASLDGPRNLFRILYWIFVVSGAVVWAAVGIGFWSIYQDLGDGPHILWFDTAFSTILGAIASSPFFGLGLAIRKIPDHQKVRLTSISQKMFSFLMVTMKTTLHQAHRHWRAIAGVVFILVITVLALFGWLIYDYTTPAKVADIPGPDGSSAKFELWYARNGDLILRSPADKSSFTLRDCYGPANRFEKVKAVWSTDGVKITMADGEHVEFKLFTMTGGKIPQ